MDRLAGLEVVGPVLVNLFNILVVDAGEINIRNAQHFAWLEPQIAPNDRIRDELYNVDIELRREI